MTQGMNRPLKYVLLLLVIVNGLFPAVWLLLTSFKTESERSDTPSRGRAVQMA